jgi:acetone carboxylase, gamma subunit
MSKVKITECLSIDLVKETWLCNRCDAELISAREPYMKGCLLYERPGAEIYGPPIRIAEGESVNYAPDQDFMRIIEFYCPNCGTLMEVQYLPPGHPIPVDIELDIDKLKSKYSEKLK